MSDSILSELSAGEKRDPLLTSFDKFVSVTFRIFNGPATRIAQSMPLLKPQIMKSYMRTSPEGLISVALFSTLVTGIVTSVMAIYGLIWLHFIWLAFLPIAIPFVFPYIDATFEYPPVSGLILYFASNVGQTFQGYYNVVGALSLIAILVIAWSAWSVAKLRGTTLKPLYFMLPSVIIYGIYNFDLFHAMFVVLGLQAFLMNRKSASATALGLAIATKLTSFVLIPVFLIQLRNRKDVMKYLLTSGGVVALFNAPLMIANYGNWIQTYTYLSNYGLEDAWFGWIFQGTSNWFYAKIFGFAIMGILLLRVYTLNLDVTTKSFLALSAYLFGTYIYSPQFNLLLIPLIAILSIEHPSLYLWDAANAAIILTCFVGTDYCPMTPYTYPQFFALIRAVFLVWMALSLLKREGYTWRSMLSLRPQKLVTPAWAPSN